MFLDLVREGGPLMWVIVGCGALAFGVFVERSLHLHRARIKADDFLEGVFNILRRQSVDEAITICDETPGPVAYLVKTAIMHRRDSKQAMRDALEDISLAEVSRMERRLVVIALVAQIAPLLGLLGTVLGMVESLLVMQQQAPLVQSVDMADGLLRALTTTAAGLTVAIPSYAAFNLLVIKVDRIVLDMEKAASEVSAFLTTSAEDGKGTAEA